MIATITNPSTTLTLNELDISDSGGVNGSGANLGQARCVAVGGGRLRALPYPFSHVTIAPLGTSILPVRPRDLRQREAGMGNGHGTHDAGEVWNQLLAAKLCIFAQAVQAAFFPAIHSDQEETFITAMV
jgi:hypothetical protein